MNLSGVHFQLCVEGVWIVVLKYKTYSGFCTVHENLRSKCKRLSHPKRKPSSVQSPNIPLKFKFIEQQIVVFTRGGRRTQGRSLSWWWSKRPSSTRSTSFKILIIIFTSSWRSATITLFMHIFSSIFDRFTLFVCK